MTALIQSKQCDIDSIDIDVFGWGFFPPRSAIYASRLYLNQYHTTHPERLATNKEGGPKISGKSHESSVASFLSYIGDNSIYTSSHFCR